MFRDCNKYTSRNTNPVELNYMYPIVIDWAILLCGRSKSKLFV